MIYAHSTLQGEPINVANPAIFLLIITHQWLKLISVALNMNNMYSAILFRQYCPSVHPSRYGIVSKRMHTSAFIILIV